MPLLGSKLSDALKTDFFTWFNLDEVDRSPDGEAVLISFKPTGPAFRSFVTVEVTTDSSETIRSLGLLLARLFIADSRNGIFARDIAKSFLRSAVPADLPDLVHLANQIEYLGNSSQPMIAGPRPVPDLPKEPTPGYLVYLGMNRCWERMLGKTEVRLENIGRSGEPVLSLFVSAR